MNRRARVLGFLLLVTTALSAAALDRIAFAPTLLGTNTPSFAAAVSDVMGRAVELMGRLYGESFTVESNGGAPAADYTASTIATQDGDTFSLVLTLKRAADGVSSQPMALSAPVAADTPLWISRATALLWSSFHGFHSGLETAAPVYVDELPVSELSPYAVPLGLAVTPDGTLAAALSMTCVELDHTFRQIGEPGKSLAERASPIYLSGVQTTPGGSFLMKPSMGRDLYKLQPGSADRCACRRNRALDNLLLGRLSRRKRAAD